MKVQSIKVLTSGQGQKGPWTLVEASFEGREGVYKGFYYDKPLSVGQEVEVEFSKEEYKGNMEDRFKIVYPKKSSVNEMAIKMEIAKYGGEILRKLDLILEHLDVRDVKAELERVRNMEPMKPTWETDELKEEDVPF